VSIKGPIPSPHFIERSDLLTPDQCLRVVHASSPYLARSTTSLGISASRTSWQRTLQATELVELLGDQTFETRMRAVMNAPVEHREPWQVVRYQPGQEFSRHQDWFYPNAPQLEAKGGQRTISVIIYLCDVALGGATHFPLLGKLFQPKCGKLLAWNNVDSNGAPLAGALHAGMPPHSEDKWVLVSWYRQRPYRDVPLDRRLSPV
jgi:prolyl 4-hydroxylase